MQKIIIIILLFFFQNVAVAEQKNYFLMLKNSKVNVRYGPSFDYPVKFFYKKINLPIKVIDKKENFRRIIDHKKNSGWIHISQLRKANSLIVLKDKILFKNNSKFSKPIIILEKGRLVLIKKCISNWCNIKTDKYRGWVQTDNVWGI
tara:strand:- start:201 stop:641 length:441 start_codon:yes stop_codon:yes gene_type:complete